MADVAPLIGALFQGVAKQGKQRKTRAKTGEKSEAQTHQQHGELSSYKEPTPVERIRTHARDAKVRATQDWVDGRMDTTQHNRVHARANHVLAGKSTREFKGKTGERKGKMW
jgi:hypothetical protein